MPYEPTIVDLLWARNLLKLVVDGGMIVYPNTELQYRVLHSKQTLVLMNPHLLGINSFAKEVHQISKLVFAKLNYTVESIGGGG
jgi:hypothetical protein